MIDSLNLSAKETAGIATAFANARSLLVYFILFILAQIFTVILVVDAVSSSISCLFLLISFYNRFINVIQFNLLRWSLLNLA
jgi:uncharacterized membrane-anchored protein